MDSSVQIVSVNISKIKLLTICKIFQMRSILNICCDKDKYRTGI